MEREREEAERREAEEALHRKVAAESDALKASLVGRRKVHREAGKEASLGFTFKKLASNGMFEVSTLKDGGFAQRSALIHPKDIIYSIEGVQCQGMSLAVFADSLLGTDGSTVDLAVLRGGHGDVTIVTCTRSVFVAEEAQVLGDALTAPEPPQEAQVEAAEGRKIVSLGFTYKQSSKDGSAPPTPG